MGSRRKASAKQSPERKGLIPDALRWPSARDRLLGSRSTDELEALKQSREDWYAENGYDYRDWQTRHRVERGL